MYYNKLLEFYFAQPADYNYNYNYNYSYSYNYNYNTVKTGIIRIPYMRFQNIS